MPDKTSPAGKNDDIEAVLGIGGKKRNTGGGGRRWLVPAAIAVVAVIAGYFVWGGGGSATVSYRTDAAARADIEVLVTATGTVEPTNQVEVSSELSGIVRSVSADYNAIVKAGDVLVELDTDKLESTVASSRASLIAAQARVTEAEATLSETERDLLRKQNLAQSNVVSAQELEVSKASYDRAVAALESAQADVEAAEANLRLNETNLEKASITSPIDGVVLDRNVETGQVVAASLSAPTLFTIAEDLSQMEVQVDIDEADVGMVKEGQAATFTVDAYTGQTFEAEITQVRYGSEVVQNVVTYKAVLSADNSHLLLRPGMTATAEIVVEEANDVLTISSQALRYTPPSTDDGDSRGVLGFLMPGRPPGEQETKTVNSGTEREVWVLRDGVAVNVPVTIGVSDGLRTEIVAGDIAEGDRLIVATITANN